MLKTCADWINNNNLMILFSAILTIFLVGFVKIFLKKIISAYQRKAILKWDLNKKEGQELGAEKYDDKWYSDILSTFCTLLICAFAFVLAMLWYLYYLNISDFYVNSNFYLEFLSIVAMTKVVYAAYEGVGVVSLKELLKNLFSLIFSGVGKGVDKAISSRSNEIIEIIEKVIPLTESGKDDLLKVLKGKEVKNEEQTNINEKN